MRSAKHYAVGVQVARALFTLLVSRGEDVPETQGLVACACYDRAAIGAHCQVKNAVCVSRECADLLHCGVLPHVDLVVRVAVGAHYFVEGLAEHQVAHL